MESRKLCNIYGFDGGNYAGNVYDKNDIAPTLTNMQGGNRQPMIIDEVKELGFMDNGTGKHQSNTVVSENGLAPTVTTVNGGGTQQIKVLTEQSIVAMRGRNPENPSDRTVGAPTEQRLEPNSQGICNTLTSVTKDNLVMEQYYLSEKGKRYVCDPKRGMCTDINADVCQTLTATGQSNWTGSFVSPDIDRLEKSTNIGSEKPTLIHLKDGRTITSNDCLTQYRIRKLTPRGCYRLMAVPEKDIDKMLEVNSNTQCYKQAGNSIVVNCLIAIFSQMGIQGIPRWNEGLSEKYK